jgi:hypothetical protein
VCQDTQLMSETFPRSGQVNAEKRRQAKKPTTKECSEDGTDDERQMWAGRAAWKACGAKSLRGGRGLGGI